MKDKHGQSSSSLLNLCEFTKLVCRMQIELRIYISSDQNVEFDELKIAYKVHMYTHYNNNRVQNAFFSILRILKKKTVT